MAADTESLIVLSDVHLGSDLVAHAPANAGHKRSPEIDRDLTRLIDHYRQHPPDAGRWRLVIAGDLIDFIGMALVAAPTELETLPSDEERAHGLGNARDHAVAKMRAVASRHRDVWDALARFVAAGNALTIIRGNHDLELYWAEVQEELTRTLLASADSDARSRGDELDRDAFLARIDHSPWFFYRDGVAFIEHGHQYDAYCATENVLSPLSPIDPLRVARGFCDVLLRFVVRQTPGMSEHGHEEMGVIDYLRFGWRLGASGMVALGLRFARAIRELFRLRRGYLDGATVSLRAQHEQAIARFAAAGRYGLSRVRALWRMQVPPVTRTVAGILGSVLLDRFALALSSIGLLLALAVAGLFQPWMLIGVALVLPMWLFGHWYFTQRRKIDPVHELASRAAAIAVLFPAPFIVMGHTHVTARQAVSEHATYINVGSWAEEEGESGRASRAHLVIHPGDDGATARFLYWDGVHGPTEITG